MGTVRTNAGRGSSADAARLAKRKQNRNHYHDTVMAGIYPDVPNVPTVEPTARAMLDDIDLLAHLEVDSRRKPFVDRIRSYEEYTAMGWNPDVMQYAKFDSPDSTKENPNAKRTMYRYLAAADGADTGLIFNSAPFVNGKAQWNDDGTPMVSSDPMGRWHLDRSPRGECEVPRSRTNFFVEGSEGLKQISKNIVHGLESDAPFIFVSDLDRNEIDPNLRAPVVIDKEHWIEQAQVVQIGERFFAHRNLLGTLRFETLEGKPGPSYPIMEVDPKSIKLKRAAYATQCKNWRELTIEERSQRRFKGHRSTPHGAGYESFLVKAEGVLAGKDNYFVEVKKNDAGKWVPVRS